MKYESVAQALEQLQKLSKTYMAYTHAMGVLELDAATAAPSGSWEGRGVTSGILSEVMYNLIADSANGELIAYLQEHATELDAGGSEQELSADEPDPCGGICGLYGAVQRCPGQLGEGQEGR